MADQFLTEKAYSSTEVMLELGGYRIVGFVTDSKCSVSKNDDVIIPQEGIDGDVSLSLSNKKMGTLTISLQNTSPSNAVLESFVAQAYSTGYAAFPLIMEDPSGSSLLSTIAWVQTQPDYEVAEEIGQRDWVIGVANAVTAPNLAVSGAMNAMEYYKGV